MASLYRLLDADGALLYVGVTTNGKIRMTSHRSRKPWWPEVAETQWTEYETREAAFMAERQAILEENPIWNRNRGGSGRPPIGPVFELRLDPDLGAQVRATAKADGRPVSETIRRLLMVALAVEQNQPQEATR